MFFFLFLNYVTRSTKIVFFPSSLRFCINNVWISVSRLQTRNTIFSICLSFLLALFNFQRTRWLLILNVKF